MNFQDRLYRLRKERGISQEELANAVGVSRQAVQKWESGASAPDLANLTALSDYFGVTLDYLLKGLEPAPAEPPADGAGRFYPPLRFEYKSRRTLFGLPLVHVNVGRFCMPRARGILAVGNVATGVVSLGLASAGLISLGAASLGLFALGGLALGGLAVGASPWAGSRWAAWRWAGWRWAAAPSACTPWAARRWPGASRRGARPPASWPSGTR